MTVTEILIYKATGMQNETRFESYFPQIFLRFRELNIQVMC